MLFIFIGILNSVRCIWYDKSIIRLPRHHVKWWVQTTLIWGEVWQSWAMVIMGNYGFTTN